MLCLQHDGVHADRQLKCSVVLKVTYMYTHSVGDLLELISRVGISNAWPASAFDTYPVIGVNSGCVMCPSSV
jgi:hypothetical protein